MLKKNEFPCEITFKVVFRNGPEKLSSIKSCLDANSVDYKIEEKPSSGAKFISFTITAMYNSEELLNSICSSISTIEGYMTMF